MTIFGKILIDNGVDIIFGHSAHHIPPKIYEYYKNKIITDTTSTKKNQTKK